MIIIDGPSRGPELRTRSDRPHHEASTCGRRRTHPLSGIERSEMTADQGVAAATPLADIVISTRPVFASEPTRTQGPGNEPRGRFTPPSGDPQPAGSEPGGASAGS
jgi:hypothetical protein